MVDSDLGQVLLWRNHINVRRCMFTQHEVTKLEHRRWFESSNQNPSRHCLIFELDRIPSGYVGFTEQPHGKVADWGFYVAPGSAKGSGRLLGEAALDYAFDMLMLHKICGQAISYNKRSIQFHCKLGFHQEGVLRDQYFDGEHFYSVFCYGLLAGEWRGES